MISVNCGNNLESQKTENSNSVLFKEKLDIPQPINYTCKKVVYRRKERKFR